MNEISYLGSPQSDDNKIISRVLSLLSVSLRSADIRYFYQ